MNALSETEITRLLYQETVRRFWTYVIKHDNGIWEWVGAKQYTGYGVFSLRTGKTVRAHRFAWEITFGLIPLGLVVMHVNDIRHDVNPANLRLGTQKENIHDMLQKGRRRKPKHPQCG